MLAGNLIDGLIDSIEPESVQAGVGGRVVRFRNGRSAFLPTSRETEDDLQLLELLQEREDPALVTIAPSDPLPIISSVDAPIVGRIWEMTEIPEGQLVYVDRSAARHVLPRTLDVYEQLMNLLVPAWDAQTVVTLREDPVTHDILDASVDDSGEVSRLFPEAEAAPAAPAESPALAPATVDVESVDSFDESIGEGAPTEPTSEDPLEGLDSMSDQKADDFINEMRSTGSCGMPDALESCVPFRYPDNGCWARAHRMCEILDSRGITAGKIWIYGQSLTVKTSNSPRCRVAWQWHVAALIKSSGSGEPLVLDPSIFDKAVTVAEFLEALQDPNATVAFSGMDPFFRTKNGATVPERPVSTRRAIDETESYLQIYRRKLAARAPNPPFQCPA